MTIWKLEVVWDWIPPDRWTFGRWQGISGRWWIEAGPLWIRWGYR